MDRPISRGPTAKERGSNYKRHSGPQLRRSTARDHASLSNMQRSHNSDPAVSKKYFRKKLFFPLKESDLLAWAEITDAGQLILMMCNQIIELQMYLNGPYIESDICLLVRSVSFAITAQHHKASIRKLLETVCRSDLLDRHFCRYLIDKQTDQAFWTEAKVFIIDVLEIIKTCVEMFPNFAVKYVVALSHLKTAASNVCEDKDLLETIAQTLSRTKEVYDEEEEKKIVHLKGPIKKADDDQQPPDDFRLISVIPTIEDLKENHWPFLRSAIINGRYENVMTYLDIQFRLMKQDFILPLRQSINQFKASECRKNFSSFDVRVYSKVRIVGSAYNDDGINHVLQFDVSGLKSVKWDFSKRLIYGSLLCLSKDNFETVLFATVADHSRDSSLLAQGFITVNFKSSLDLVFNSSPLDEYIMVESVAYFESYVHVLKGLQEMSSELPLSQYIVSCEKTLEPPKYLFPYGDVLKEPIYNLSCLMNNKERTVIPVLTTTKWPRAEEMCLNQSQREAVMSALTKELALIQGPPGTGKTFVGLKIVEILLAHEKEIYGNKVKPILLVCYGNHALDQFSEGVLKFCPDGLVRVGGKSSSEKLEEFNIKNLRKSNKASLIALKTSRRNCIDELKKVSKDITDIQNTLHNLGYDIVSEHALKPFILNDHFNSLTRYKTSTQRSYICEWLNAPKVSTMVALTEMVRNYLSLKILETVLPVKKKPKLTRRMNVIERATLYKIFINRYKDDLYRRKQFLLKQTKTVKNLGELESIDIEFEMLKSKLPTHRYTIEKIFPAEFMKQLVELYGQSAFSFVDGPITYWLLGLDRDLNCLLDDIETLKKYATGRYNHTATMDDREDLLIAEASRVLDGEASKEVEYISQLTKVRSNIVTLEKRVESLGITEDYMDDNSARPNFYSKTQTTFREFRDKLQSAHVMKEDEVEAIGDPWSLSTDKRFSLYKHWIFNYKLFLTEQMNNLVKKYSELFDRKTEASEEENLMILKKAKVIGMTTTGAAIHRSVLQALGCRIIVVEEAAEVLESHIITSLNKHCSHLILKGDHQQLRPNPAVYELAKEYKLDISLFERLVKNDLPHTVLQLQHRMRPEISKLMKHIYPGLLDHESIKSYEHIRGMSKDVFFISHKECEQHDDDTQSKANAHEAHYIIELCKYLLLQGYEASQISILTTYSGQLYLIKKTMTESNLADPVRVTTVDNFQGEENDIILLSLVRSNEENKAGFLKIDNRICVALSRAKKGLYAIGNFDMLSNQSKLWHKIVDTLQENNFIGEFLPIECPNHSDRKQLIQTKSDFKDRPEGGCGQACMSRLNCGHVCERSCHGYDPQHQKFTCRKSCIRKCPAGHPCKLKCFETCQCKVLVDKTVPHCGHLIKLFCYIPPEEAKCEQSCTATLECEHKCSGLCGSCYENEKHAECHFKVDKVLPCDHLQKLSCCISPDEAKCSQACRVTLECGHLCSGKCGSCHEKNKHRLCFFKVDKTLPCGHIIKAECVFDISQLICDNLCGALLDCGHRCEGNCNDCLNGNIHVACMKKCDKTLPCGHPCESVCGLPCSPCSLPCPHRCRHKSCNDHKSKRLCGQPCSPCKNKCLNKCQHRQCTKNCCEPCDVLPCARKCTKKLYNRCRHKCSGLCGELCVCAICESISLINQEDKIMKTISSSDVHTCPNSNSGTLHSDIQVVAVAESADQIIELTNSSHEEVAETHREDQSSKSNHFWEEKVIATVTDNQNNEIIPSDIDEVAIINSENINNESNYFHNEEAEVTASGNQINKSTHSNIDSVAETPSDNQCKESNHSRIEELEVNASENQDNKLTLTYPNKAVTVTENSTDTNIENKNVISKNKDKVAIKEHSPKLATPQNTDKLILKIPSCSHNFFVDEIDEYVKNYDVNGTKFIPCPKCSAPIQNCNRYKDKNLERFLLREEMKKSYVTVQPVSDREKEKLTLSMKLIRKTKYFADIQDFDISKIKTQLEFQMISFLVKTVFLLNEIAYIDDEACGLMPSVDKMRTALKKVKQNGRVTKQQEHEFKLELSRCLTLACLKQLDWLMEQEKTPLIKGVTESIQLLQMPKIDHKILDDSRKIVLAVRDCIITCHTSYCYMNESYDQGMQVLLSGDIEHLSDIISIKRGSSLNVKRGSSLNVKRGSSLNVKRGSSLNVKRGSSLNVKRESKSKKYENDKRRAKSRQFML